MLRTLLLTLTLFVLSSVGLAQQFKGTVIVKGTTTVQVSLVDCGTGVQHCVSMTWDDSNTDPVTFNVYRAVSTTFGVVRSGLTNKAWIDTNVSSGQTWKYYVTAVRTSDNAESGPSNTITVTIP